MKKMKSGNRGSAAKANPAPKTVDEYLAGVPEPARSTLNKVRAAIRSAVPPEASETISYRIPAFKYNGVLVWFAAFSDHCSLFPTAAIVEAFKNELKGFSTSKGTILSFPRKSQCRLHLLKNVEWAGPHRTEKQTAVEDGVVLKTSLTAFRADPAAIILPAVTT